ncbi:MAG: response regulator [Anaerolineae bacterium]|nr:MAG: response regulator [Anaerolineae bacterium]
MASYRVLIVDDQRDVRRALRAAIESLKADIQVVDVPSGEEALLEVAGQEVDLLVADVRLAGISGLELLEKLRRKKPDLKAILVTGLLDASIRQQVADAGASAFFIKPIAMADFLDAVERCLGLVNAAPLEAALPETQDESLSDYLTSLRQQLEAISAVLLNEHGRVLARAGDLPDASVESALFPALMAAFSAARRVAHLLQQSPPNDLMYFNGPKYGIFLAHVGEVYALVVAVNPYRDREQLHQHMSLLYSRLDGLVSILRQLGVPLIASEHAADQDETTETLDEEEVESEPELEALLEQGASVDVDDVDAFWDTAATQINTEGVGGADALTYEQAVQLGLAPETDDEEEAD